MPPEQNKPTAEQLAKWCNGTWLTDISTATIEELVIDTRKIADPEAALFIALKGSHRDGFKFVADAYAKGIRCFLVEQAPELDAFEGAAFIQVKDTLHALQQIATQYRKLFDIPVIGVTGSNGKTIVKEWLYQLLHNRYNTVRSPKSYNSQIGVPLSVWLMEPTHELGIFEAGISQPGEMSKLEHIIQPTIGVFTNMGEAHSDGFLNVRQKANEKLQLFRRVQQLVYCKDHPEVNEAVAQYLQQTRGYGDNQQVFSWSAKMDADLRITSVVPAAGKTTITGNYNGEERTITIPFTDPASVENTIHCWCVMLLLNIAQQTIQERMLLLQPVSMRLELRHGINNCTIINDTYNSDLTSLLIALDYLDQQKQHPHHTVILSDMLQMGKPDADLYEEVAEHVNRRNIQRFIGIGPALYKHKATFRKYKKLRSIFFKSTEEFLKKFHLLTFDHEAILVKGARAFTFEKVSMLMEQKVHQTVLSINLSSMQHNLNVFRNQLKPNVKVMAMVKAFSYGSGSFEIANLLQYSGVDYLSVAYTDEGISLRKAGITMPIMVMSPDATAFDRMIAWKLEPEIFSMASLNAFTAIAQTLEVAAYPVHIKLDTGMHRLGFVASEIDELAVALKDNTSIQVASIFSHLAASDDADQDGFTATQAKAFDTMSSKIKTQLPNTPILHLCNSAAIARHPNLHYDMIRLGIGLYGIDSSNKLNNELKQIGTLKTTIAQIKTIPAGDTVGYGRRGHADKETKIATICIGYADGYPRSLGNGNAYVLIHGKRCKTVGVICMDMCMVDVTDVPDVKAGDEAIIFSAELPIAQLGRWANTIPYEIMTGISQRVKRIYENEI